MKAILVTFRVALTYSSANAVAYRARRTATIVCLALSAQQTDCQGTIESQQVGIAYRQATNKADFLTPYMVLLPVC